MRARGSVSGESAKEQETREHGHGPGAHPHQDVLDLHGRIGNQAVSRLFAPAVQRASAGETPALEDDYGQVISGHGTFNENQLADHPTARRKKAGTFTVPPGMTVVMYAPPGAYLDNAVANRVENRNPPAASELEMKQTDAGKIQGMPGGYPYTFAAGQEVIDYTVYPPDKLSVDGSPKTVTAATALRILVEEAIGEGHKRVHYACCSSGHSDKADFAPLFTHKGWYVRLKQDAQ